MKTKTVLVFMLIFFYSFRIYSEGSISDFKVVGYYSLNSAMKEDISKFPFDKVTHVNLFFITPDQSGNIKYNLDALIPFVEAAKQHNVKVLYSISGPGYHEIIKKENRPKLIKELISLVLDYNLDGIDSDLEWGYTLGPLGMQTSLSFPSVDYSYTEPDSNFGPFIKELSQALKAHNKLLTAALPSRPAKEITQDILDKFDFINIMSYDNRDIRRPDRAGNHSSYVDAMDDLDYYLNTLNVPKDRLVLGVPFYGRGFGPELTDPIIDYMNYNEIVSTYSGAEWVDHWHLPNGYILYYNGIPTIKNKTKLAKDYASGIMIWELSYDLPGSKSLLNAIVESIR